MKVTQLLAVAAAQHGAFSRKQAGALGYNREAIRWQVRKGQWCQLTQDVFMIGGAPHSWEQRLWCALLEAGDSAVLSHRSAAQVLGIAGFSRDVVELTMRGTLRHALVLSRLHRTSWLPPEHITKRRGLRVTTVARCVFEL